MTGKPGAGPGKNRLWGLRGSAGALQRVLQKTLNGRWAVAVPAAAAGVFLVALFLQLRKILDVLYWSSDIAFMPLLAEDLDGLQDAGRVNMGNTPYYSTLWLLMLTKRLPFHRAIWDFGPYLLALVAAGLLAWAAWRMAGRWSAAATFALVVAATPAALVTQVVPGVRIVTWASIAALASFLIFFAVRPRRLWVWVVLGSATAVVAGTAVASDPLFLAAGLVPFVGSGLVVWAIDRGTERRKLGIGVVAITAASVVIAYTTQTWMHGLGFAATLPRKGFQFVTQEEFLANVPMVVESLLYLGNGYFFGRSLGLGSLARLAAAGTASVGVAVVFIAVVRSVRPADLRGPAGPAGAGGDEDRAVTLRRLWIVFWGLAALGVLGTTLFSTVAVGAGVAATRYLVPVYYAVAAVVPVWAATTQLRRAAVTACVVLFALLSVRELSGFYRGAEAFPLISRAAEIRDYLSDEDLDRGYAAYWSAHAFTWKSDLRIRVYPVHQCRPGSDVLCPFALAVRDSWYVAQPGRSFILVDPTAVDALPAGPPAAYGPPSEVASFGDLTVYVYDHDVAANFEGPFSDSPGIGRDATQDP